MKRFNQANLSKTALCIKLLWDGGWLRAFPIIACLKVYRFTFSLPSRQQNCHLFFSLQIYFGIWVTVCVTASWVGATHSIKYLYLRRPKDNEYDDPILVPHDTTDLNMTVVQTKYVSRKKCNMHWFNIPFRSNLCHYLT